MLPVVLAIVAAITALVGVLYMTSEGFDQTENRLAELRAQANKQREEEATYNKERVLETVDYIAHLRDRLKQEGKLTDVTEGHMRAMLSLSDASAEAKVKAGELHKVTIQDGKKSRDIYISQAVALNLANDGVAEGVTLNNRMRERQAELGTELIKNKKHLENLTKTYDEWRHAVNITQGAVGVHRKACLLYTSPSPRD